MHQLYTQVEDYLLSQLNQAEHLALENIKINVRPLPERLNLEACQHPIVLDTRLNERLSSRTTVSVQCAEPNWRLFVSADIYAETLVVMATQPILRHAVISQEAVSLILRPITQIRQQHLHQLDQVIGHRAKRPISPNTLISIQMLDPPFWVMNNHEVTIITQIGSLEIRTPGVALSNGLAQEQIQVRNLRSDKIINAIVIAPNTVMVP
jgi:flagella basal body P-ring formation protein FlgA